MHVLQHLAAEKDVGVLVNRVLHFFKTQPEVVNHRAELYLKEKKRTLFEVMGEIARGDFGCHELFLWGACKVFGLSVEVVFAKSLNGFHCGDGNEVDKLFYMGRGLYVLGAADRSDPSTSSVAFSGDETLHEMLDDSTASLVDWELLFSDTQAVRERTHIRHAPETLSDSLVRQAVHEVGGKTVKEEKSVIPGPVRKVPSVVVIDDEDIVPSFQTVSRSNSKTRGKKKIRGEICRSCKRWFANQTALLQHVDAVHNNQWTCMQCGQECNSANALNAHLKIHDVTSHKFVCAECGAGFPHESRLLNHMVKHSSKKNFKCSEIGCDFACKTKSELTRHLRQKHSDVVAMFKCELCPKIFPSAYALKDHGRSHSEERTVPCRYCGELFKQRKSRDLHEKKCKEGLLDLGAGKRSHSSDEHDAKRFCK